MTAGVRYSPSTEIPGISTTVSVPAPAGLVFSSGQVAPERITEPFEAELDGCFQRLSDALLAAGSSIDSLVRVTISVTELPKRDLATIRAVRDRWIDPARPPASALIGISALALPGLRTEVDGIATL